MFNKATHVYLLNVPLENDYRHTLYFTNKTSQASYFQSKKIKLYTDFSYQRKDTFIRIPEKYDDIANCNYVMYGNPLVDKWYYAFITEMKYVNDGCTDVYIETDVMQTWFFDYTVKPSFIEREHVDDDTIGLHTVPEGLETGEYICGLKEKADYSSMSSLCIVVGATSSIAGYDETGRLYTGIYSGLGYYGFNYDTAGIKALNQWLSEYDTEAKGDAIVCMFLAPKNLMKSTIENGQRIVSSDNVSTRYINFSNASETINTNKSLTKNTLNSYTPKNNKLMTYPYRYLLASNNNGGSAVYRYEMFYSLSGTTKTFLPPQFQISGCLTPGCSIRLIPLNYNGASINHEEGLNFGKFPILNWVSDVYTNWLTQNNLNIGIQLGTAALQVAAGVGTAIATGGLGGAVGGGMAVSGVSTIVNTLSQIHQQSLTPAQSKGNVNCGDVITASGQNDIHFYEMTIRKEYAQIIDEFFTMFGYKVNRVKTPNKAHRSRFWYTKTIDVNIDGAIPNKDLQIIKNCYNNGITFWRNADEIQNYTLSNGVLS